MKNVGIDMKEKLDSKFNFLSNAIANLNLQFHNVSKGKGVVEEDSILGEPVRVRIPDLIHITDLGYTLTHTYTYHAANSPPRVDFPRFDGTNPRAWVINCNNYFKIIKNVAEDQMVAMATMYFEGRAALWYHSFYVDHDDVSWPQFVEILL